MQSINDLTYQISGAAYKVHNVLGFGLLENAFKECLCNVLKKEELFVEKEKALPLVFEELKLEAGYRN